jgi:hypothetical protein
MRFRYRIVALAVFLPTILAGIVIIYMLFAQLSAYLGVYQVGSVVFAKKSFSAQCYCYMTAKPGIVMSRDGSLIKVMIPAYKYEITTDSKSWAPLPNQD